MNTILHIVVLGFPVNVLLLSRIFIVHFQVCLLRFHNFSLYCNAIKDCFAGMLSQSCSGYCHALHICQIIERKCCLRGQNLLEWAWSKWP